MNGTAIGSIWIMNGFNLVRWCHNGTGWVQSGTDSVPEKSALPLWSPHQLGGAVIFCLRFMNFCVLAALGVVLLAPAARPDRAIDRLVPGYSARTASISDTLAWQGADRLMANLAGVKAEIHDDVCRHAAFVLLRVRDCGPKSDS